MEQKESTKEFPLESRNYKLLIIGIGVIILGLFLLSGGGSDDPNVFKEDIFSFRRIVLAPLIIMAGFVFNFYAILHRPKNKS